MLRIEENWKNISTTVSTLVKQVSYYYLYSKYYYLYSKYYDFYCNWMLKKNYYYSILLFVLILKIEGNCKKKKHITIIIIIIVTKKNLNKYYCRPQASGWTHTPWGSGHLALGLMAWEMGMPRVSAHTSGCCHLALELVEALACRHLAQGLPHLGC